MPAPDVAALLIEMERADPAAADAARLAVDWLTGGQPLESIAQLDVCEFLWYTLPTKVAVADGERLGVARALGRLLRLGGMDRYAALCLSGTTARILRVYRTHGENAGLAAYQQALDATGVLPPDVPELSWSSIMGPEELAAHGACSAALELAIVAGELTPGETRERERLTSRWLLTPRPELGGDNWLQRVHGERLNRWVLGRGTARRALAQFFDNFIASAQKRLRRKAFFHSKKPPVSNRRFCLFRFMPLRMPEPKQTEPSCLFVRHALPCVYNYIHFFQ